MRHLQLLIPWVISYTDNDQSRIPTWLQTERQPPVAGVQQPLIFVDETTSAGTTRRTEKISTWRTSDPIKLTSIPGANLTTHPLLQMLKTQNNIADRDFNHIEHAWYRDGDLFLIPDTDKVMRSDYHFTDKNNYPILYEYNGDPSLDFDNSKNTLKRPDFHIDNADNYCKKLGGEFFIPHSQAEMDSLFDSVTGRNDKVCNIRSQGNAIQLFINLKRFRYKMQNRMHLPNTGIATLTEEQNEWRTSERWWSNQRSDFCISDSNLSTDYGHTYDSYIPSTTQCNNEVWPPRINCWSQQPSRFQKFKESSMNEINKLRKGTNAKQYDCVQVQCDNGKAFWQTEPCDSNNFVPICRVPLIDKCKPKFKCSDQQNWCGSIAKHSEQLSWINLNYENELKKFHPNNIVPVPSVSPNWQECYIQTRTGTEAVLTPSNFRNQLLVVQYDSTKHGTCPCQCRTAPSPYINHANYTQGIDPSDITFQTRTNAQNVGFPDFSQVPIDYYLVNENHKTDPANKDFYPVPFKTDRVLKCDDDIFARPTLNPLSTRFFNANSRVTITCDEQRTFEAVTSLITSNRGSYYYRLPNNNLELVPFVNRQYQTRRDGLLRFEQQHVDFCEPNLCPDPHTIAAPLSTVIAPGQQKRLYKSGEFVTFNCQGRIVNGRSCLS